MTLKKYALRLIIFLLPLVSLFGMLEYKLSLIPNSYSYKKQLIEKNAGKIQILVLGSSHAYNDFNPAVW
jgi:hypothetical protein